MAASVRDPRRGGGLAVGAGFQRGAVWRQVCAIQGAVAAWRKAHDPGAPPGERSSVAVSLGTPLTARCIEGSLVMMDEITFQVVRDEASGWLVASWDSSGSTEGITTQGEDLRDLQQQVSEAVSVHFDEGQSPLRIRLHFVNDPILVQALNSLGTLPALLPSPHFRGWDSTLPVKAAFMFEWRNWTGS